MARFHRAALQIDGVRWLLVGDVGFELFADAASRVQIGMDERTDLPMSGWCDTAIVTMMGW